MIAGGPSTKKPTVDAAIVPTITARSRFRAASAAIGLVLVASSAVLLRTNRELLTGRGVPARMLDEMTTVTATKGIMMVFDDFVIGVEQFGQRIQPLMRSRRNLAVAA